MAKVFRFKSYEPNSKSGRATHGASSDGKTLPNNGNSTDSEALKSVARKDPLSPDFDWVPHQQLEFINKDKDTIHLDKDRTLVRTHVMKDLNKKERMKRNFRVSTLNW
jgi:hypothetical protein